MPVKKELRQVNADQPADGGVVDPKLDGRIKHKPGDRVANLELVDRVMKPSVLGGTFATGDWWAKCLGCGEVVLVSYQAMYKSTLRGRCCGKPECDPSPKILGRPVDRSHIGKEYGRLLVLDWTQADGWICYCRTCEGEEKIRTIGKVISSGEDYCQTVPMRQQKLKAQQAKEQANAEAVEAQKAIQAERNRAHILRILAGETSFTGPNWYFREMMAKAGIEADCDWIGVPGEKD